MILSMTNDALQDRVSEHAHVIARVEANDKDMTAERNES